MARSREEILALGDVNPTWQDIIAKRGGHYPSLSGDVNLLRAGVATVVKTTLPPTPPEISESSLSVQGRHGHAINCVVVRPATSPTPEPLLVMFHGGGHVLGIPEMDIPQCRAWAAACGVACLCVDYRLAPEFPFPAAVEDAHDVVKWAAQHGIEELKVDLARGFFVGGVSAGANLADVVGHLARDEDMVPPLTGLLEFIPQLVHPEAAKGALWEERYLAREQNRDADALGWQTIKYYTEMYKPAINSPLYSPLIHPKGHAGLPPVCLFACGWDPVRDDSLIYHDELATAGVNSKLYVYPGLPHGFWVYETGLEESAQVRRDAIEALQWLIDQTASAR